MNYLKKSKSRQLILFFNGWGMDENAVRHLKTGNYDLIECHDYATLSFDENKIADYDAVYVPAWSLGVWVAAYCLQNSSLPVKKSIAINGTLRAVDDDYGIPPGIFKATLEGWNDKNRERFYRRMMGGSKALEAGHSKLGNRSFSNQKQELASLSQRFDQKNTPDYIFDTAIIGENDAIFSKKKQLNYWKSKALCKHVDMPHYPFLYYQSWDEIIEA